MSFLLKTRSESDKPKSPSSEELQQKRATSGEPLISTPTSSSMRNEEEPLLPSYIGDQRSPHAIAFTALMPVTMLLSSAIPSLSMSIFYGC
uniref:Uncharacterized protein n=1 Tax=Oryza barthii TaxID=65489 RepID=A0A0D3GHY5_9ORYZ